MSKKKALVIKHVDFEGPAKLLDYFDHSVWDLQFLNVYSEPIGLHSNDFDLLIIMGGPMSVNDHDDYPWLIKEKEFIASAIDNKVKVLGVCLGAQLIASVLGEPVYLAENKEIGWYPLLLNDGSLQHAFHWHGETFDLPEGAELIAASAACKNQIFKYGKNVLALQCHLELDMETLNGLLKHCKEDLTEEYFVMNEDDIIVGFDVYNRLITSYLTALLSQFLGE